MIKGRGDYFINAFKREEDKPKKETDSQVEGQTENNTLVVVEGKRRGAQN